MEHLGDILLREGTRQRFIREVGELIDRTVEARRGLVGLTLRSGYKVAKGVRGDFVRDALDDMMAAFVGELDPLYAAHGGPVGFGDFMVRQQALVASQMLKVTDRRRDASRNGTLRRAYDMLSPIAATTVERSVPELGRVIQKYLDEFLQLEPAPRYVAA